VTASRPRAFAALHKARLIGLVSACFFLLTVLLVADGLQALMREDFNRINLPLGGQVLISGAMPLQAKAHTDIVAVIEGLDGLSFTPLTDFKGLWFGAHMWRAALDAGDATKPGQAVLTIVDMVPAKSTTGNATIMVQNPSQIYAITVWPSAEAMQAAHFSLGRRLTGLSSFLLASLSVTCGIGIGAWHMFLNQAAWRALAAEDLFPIYGLLRTDAGYQARFSPSGREDLQPQQPMLLLTLQGVEMGSGVLSECSRLKCSALFSLDGVVPRHGWLLHYTPDPKPAPGREEMIPPPEQALQVSTS
jgi:hypothetical protein